MILAKIFIGNLVYANKLYFISLLSKLYFFITCKRVLEWNIIFKIPNNIWDPFYSYFFATYPVDDVCIRLSLYYMTPDFLYEHT